MTHSRQHWTRIFVINWGAAPAIVIVLALTVVLPLAAQAQSFKVLHNFTGGADGASPAAGLTLDKAGNLYGTASAGGAGYGTVFKLARSGTGWILNPLYQFQGGADGASPVAALV
ncbi:MAG TPA: choice-of-anchor tandem repeat GloVer-containing protein, partial [Terracidiphilus sp.]|nr:choice-of-anchor tandem repeat GloVer-containing protein [Terracidiphilus sp.]